MYYSTGAIETQRIIEIPHGVDSPSNPSKQDVEEIRDKFGLKTHHVMYFGRLHWRKGIQYLISAMSKILESNDDVNLTVSGPYDGMKASLEQMCRNLGVSENVVFTSFLPRVELSGVMMNADVVVNPSNIECYSFTIAEAISLHSSVIQAIDNTERVHELPLVKEGMNGYIIKFRDISALANQIERILSNHDLKQHLSKNSRIISQSFRSWNQVGKEFLQLFEAMMTQS